MWPGFKLGGMRIGLEIEKQRNKQANKMVRGCFLMVEGSLLICCSQSQSFHEYASKS